MKRFKISKSIGWMLIFILLISFLQCQPGKSQIFTGINEVYDLAGKADDGDTSTGPAQDYQLKSKVPTMAIDGSTIAMSKPINFDKLECLCFAHYGPNSKKTPTSLASAQTTSKFKMKGKRQCDYGVSYNIPLNFEPGSGVDLKIETRITTPNNEIAHIEKELSFVLHPTDPKKIKVFEGPRGAQAKLIAEIANGSTYFDEVIKSVEVPASKTGNHILIFKIKALADADTHTLVNPTVAVFLY